MLYKKMAIILICGMQVASATQDQAVQAPATVEGQSTAHVVVQAPCNESGANKLVDVQAPVSSTVPESPVIPTTQESHEEVLQAALEEQAGLPGYSDKQWQETLAALKHFKTVGMEGMRQVIKNASVEQAATVGAVSMFLFPMTTTGIVATGLAVAGVKKIKESKSFHACMMYGKEHGKKAVQHGRERVQKTLQVIEKACAGFEAPHLLRSKN